MNKARALYANVELTEFKHIDCYDILSNHKKWTPTVKKRKLTIEEKEDAQVEDKNGNNEEEVERRLPNRKAAKKSIDCETCRR